MTKTKMATADIRIYEAGRTDWIQTFTGKKFYPLDPDPNAIDILDIAHALANQCRFSGHTKHFYSVAQHSWLMSLVVGQDRDLCLRALLHDASEAYLSDIPRPLKLLPEFEFYRAAERRLQCRIEERFGIEVEYEEGAWRIDHPLIKRLDQWMLVVEANSRELMGPPHEEFDLGGAPNPFIEVRPMDPSTAEAAFLARFRELTAEEFHVAG